MVFNSQLFIFIFLPVVLMIYYLLHKVKLHKGAKLFLIVSSFVFYGYFNIKFVPVLLFSLVSNYCFFQMFRLIPISKKVLLRKLLLIIAVTVNLSVLFYFKYFNFFISNINKIFHTGVFEKNIMLPLGISFFTFQQISLLVDRYKDATLTYNALDYGVFASFFPQLVSGPIVLHNQLIPQIQDANRWKPNFQCFAIGIRYVTLGLAKKTLLADRFGNIVDLGYTYPIDWDVLGALQIILSYTLQIYFDFSGYSDIAIGIGKMFGFDIPTNFNSPYKAVSIADFWKRWHMTLTGFFTKYVYIPLGGNRKGRIRTYCNVLIVFALSGLWHGASWTFVLWGLLHGMALVVYRILYPIINKIPKFLIGTATFIFVNFAWVLFRAESTWQAKRIFYCLVKGGIHWEKTTTLWEAFWGNSLQLLLSQIPYSQTAYIYAVAVMTILVTLISLLIVFLAPNSAIIAERIKFIRGEGILFGVLITLCILTFTNVSTFIYFKF